LLNFEATSFEEHSIGKKTKYNTNIEHQKQHKADEENRKQKKQHKTQKTICKKQLET